MPVATACANIALIKYWGKRDLALNLPAAGSLSLTLDALRTHTEVVIHDGAADELVLDGRHVEGRGLERIGQFADLLRPPDGPRVRVVSRNDFPTGAGLASSASAFAALAVAMSAAFGKSLDDRRRSVLARRGSGSAARSIFGGWARMHPGHRDDGEDAFAEPLALNLRLEAVIAVADAGEKAIGSTEGMERTRRTSPYHDAWIDLVPRDLEAAIAAIRAADYDRLAELVEGNCLAMHADAMAARPGVIYFKASTLWAIERVRALRAEGVPVFFTIDAGPHVVAFTPPQSRDRVADALREHGDIKDVVTSAVGDGAHLVESMP